MNIQTLDLYAPTPAQDPTPEKSTWTLMAGISESRIIFPALGRLYRASPSYMRFRPLTYASTSPTTRGSVREKHRKEHAVNGAAVGCCQA